jgi:F-type H+-transporting ATPase subunit gamma
MSDTLENLRRKINGATDLESVVRTMKVLAASNIIQYEKAVISLADYYRTVELGLLVCFQSTGKLVVNNRAEKAQTRKTGAIVFGSDQGLVGQFNDVLAQFVKNSLESYSGEKRIWTVGERIQARLEDDKLPVSRLFPVPNSVNAITPIIGQLLIENEVQGLNGERPNLLIFHNKPKSGALYEPVMQHLLPLDVKWFNNVAQLKWPTHYLPEPINGIEANLHGLIRQYLFVSLFRACAESLASENASRLAAMQRAEKNIDELLEELNHSYHRLRQSTIDEELFDVISGSEALSTKKS